MVRLAMVALLCVPMLAGCQEPPAAEVEPEAQDAASGAPRGIPVPEGEAVPQPEPAPVRTYQGEHGLVINPDTPFVGIGGTSENCVLFWDTEGAAFTFVSGNATLTWTAGPSTQTLQLRTTGAADNVAVGGGSPLALPLAGVKSEFEWGIGLWADYSTLQGSVPVAQSATLAIEIAYMGDLPEPGIGTCGDSGLS